MPSTPALPLPPPGALARFWATLACVCLLALAVILALPHAQATRFHLLRNTDYIKLGWIFDRIEISPAPIDVAFVGTSHTLNGVDSTRLENALNQAGKPPLHVVNFAVPHLGDDLHDLITRLLLARKHPSLLVVEAQQVPARAAHPAYVRLADMRDIILQPFGNPDAVTDLLQLPHRQLRYFAADLTTKPEMETPPDHWDDNYTTTMHNGAVGPPRLLTPPPATLARNAARQRTLLDIKAAQYQRLGWLTFRYNDWYLHHLLQAARDHGARVVVLYLPVFQTTAAPANASWLRQYGAILTPPPAILNNPALWNDPEHLNFAGSQALTNWLAVSLLPYIHAR